jgi:formiminotetrahydrofolate cyclodeaminase
VKRHPHPQSARQLGEAVRRACVEAALAGYEDAAISGLCHEGAWEAAVSAIRGLDLDAFAEANVPADAEPADSAAARTGAIAASLLERTAALSALRGPEGFRKRARSIASRAAALQCSLRTAAQADDELVLREAQAAADSSLDIAARCAQVTTLAAEVAKNGHGATRHDAAAALRVASSAAECALALTEEHLGSVVETDWTRTTQRRIWRARFLLHRAQLQARPITCHDG